MAKRKIPKQEVVGVLGIQGDVSSVEYYVMVVKIPPLHGDDIIFGLIETFQNHRRSRMFGCNLARAQDYADSLSRKFGFPIRTFTAVVVY